MKRAITHLQFPKLRQALEGSGHDGADEVVFKIPGNRKIEN